MHGSQHASNELVDAVTLLDKGHQCRDTALIVGTGLEMREDQLLKSINLILQSHEIGDGLIAVNSLALRFPILRSKSHSPFIRIIDCLQTNVFLVLEQACAC